MRSAGVLSALILSGVFLLSGCTVRTYKTTKDRIDQDLTSGNKGYVQGSVPADAVARERNLQRPHQVIEVELKPLIKFGKKAKPQAQEPAAVPETAPGNRGYITETVVPDIVEPAAEAAPEVSTAMNKYTVQKGDTLQKISQKLYGTSKKWQQIFEANRGALKAPDKIYPGQVINVPAEALKETGENLK